MLASVPKVVYGRGRRCDGRLLSEEPAEHSECNSVSQISTKYREVDPLFFAL